MVRYYNNDQVNYVMPTLIQNNTYNLYFLLNYAHMIIDEATRTQ